MVFVCSEFKEMGNNKMWWIVVVVVAAVASLVGDRIGFNRSQADVKKAQEGAGEKSGR